MKNILLVIVCLLGVLGISPAQTSTQITTRYYMSYAGAYNSTIYYASGDTVTYNSNNYTSLVSNNKNNTPDVSPTKWVFLSSATATTNAVISAATSSTAGAVKLANGQTSDILASVATTGNYTDLTNIPASPTLSSLGGVAKAGDTMLGALVLAADPSTNMQAATKQYVDNHSATGTLSLDSSAILFNASGSPGGSANLTADLSGNLTSAGKLASKRFNIQAQSTTDCGLQQYCNSLTSSYRTPINANRNEENDLIYLQNIVDGPGRAIGPVGSVQGWTVPKLLTFLDEDDVRGIGQAISGQIVSHSISDKAFMYGYGWFDAGCGSVLNDEGCAMQVLEWNENSTDQQTTISGGTKDIPTFSSAISTTDGGYLLDITQGNSLNYVGHLNGLTSGTVAGEYDIPIVSTGTAIPASTAIATIGAELPDTNHTAEYEATASMIPVSAVTFNGATPYLKLGWVCIAGPEGSFAASPEFGQITATYDSTHTNNSALSTPVAYIDITYSKYHPSGAGIFQGGPCGTVISIDDDLTVMYRRSNYQVVGSVNGNDLIYAGPHTYGKTDVAIPRIGETAETSSSTFHLFPATEIVANLNRSGNPQLQPNMWNFQTGDTVEADAPFIVEVENVAYYVTGNTPCDSSYTCSGLSLIYSGTVANSAFKPFVLQNNNSCTLYTVCQDANGHAGKLALPKFQMQIVGPASNIFQVDKPYAAFAFINTPIGTGLVQTYGLFQDNAAGTLLKVTQNQTSSNYGTLAAGQAQLSVGASDFSAPCLEGNLVTSVLTSNCSLHATNTTSVTPSFVAGANPSDSLQRAFQSTGGAEFDLAIGGPVGQGLVIQPTLESATGGTSQASILMRAYQQPGGFYSTVLEIDNVNTTSTGTNTNVATFPGIKLVPNGGALTVGTSLGYNSIFYSEADFLKSIKVGSSNQLSIDSSGNITTTGTSSSAAIIGPTVAPTGTCTGTGQWVLSQDGHATFCSAGTWVTKI